MRVKESKDEGEIRYLFDQKLKTQVKEIEEESAKNISEKEA